jgi:hypothetical protein
MGPNRSPGVAALHLGGLGGQHHRSRARVIRHTALFDILGDGEPGGEFIEETATVVHGPHPGFGEDLPFCEIAAELTGA